MNISEIKAIGNFLETYHSDLIYIREFQRYKRNEILTIDFVKKREGSFYSFLIDFRVTRNYMAGQTISILEQTKKWLSIAQNIDDVDGFAQYLNRDKLTHGKIMTSLASKIMFLNNPWKIYPLDNWGKRALNQTDNYYKNYLDKVAQFKKINKEKIDICLKTAMPLISVLEKDFLGSISKIETVRENRIVDKILWTTGQNN